MHVGSHDDVHLVSRLEIYNLAVIRSQLEFSRMAHAQTNTHACTEDKSRRLSFVGESKKATSLVEPCGLSLAVLKTIFKDTCNVNKLFSRGYVGI